MITDGWLRADFGPWTGLWHASPDGWAPMPGHAHQDLGGFEVHFGSEPLFIDPGRGAYGDSGTATYDRSGAAHNTLLVDGQDPYPANRPYYNDGFRRHITGPPPNLHREGNGIFLRHDGYSRLNGVGTLERRWAFSETGFSITDRVDGSGRHGIERVLVTPLPVDLTDEGVVVRGAETAYRLTADTDLSTEPATRWRAYGMGESAIAIRFRTTAALPFESVLTVKVL